MSSTAWIILAGFVGWLGLEVTTQSEAGFCRAGIGWPDSRQAIAAHQPGRSEPVNIPTAIWPDYDFGAVENDLEPLGQAGRGVGWAWIASGKNGVWSIGKLGRAARAIRGTKGYPIRC